MKRKKYDFRLHPATTAAKPAAHRCDWPGCTVEAPHRAPRSRGELTRYLWFCLDHVRLYNASWNYYQGMNDEEVEADLRNDTVWNRPSWVLGSMGHRFKVGASGLFDEEDIFGGAGRARGPEGGHGSTDSEDRPPAPPPGSEEAKSLSVLGLRPPLTVESVKTRYKELVKRHHPDANGGNKDSEEKFKQVNLAYRTIMDSLGA